MVILRHRLPGDWLRSIEDRFQGPEISVAHDLAERLFNLQERGRRPARRHSRTPAAHPAGAIANSRMRIVYDVSECGLSTMLLVARQRCRERGMSSRLRVKHSSNPSRSAAAASG